jgi:uncharacterized protein (TIGR02145 family)
VTVTVSDVTCPSTVTYDGITYNIVKIGCQCWFKENLRTTIYNDNSSIPNVTDNATWTSTTTGAYCCYGNSASNCTTYGALYNWYAVKTGKLCPSGWHVPSDGEWTTLYNYLGGWEVAGGALKEAGTSHWLSPNTDATNSSGFSALPGGRRSYSSGVFEGLGQYGFWWYSTDNGASYAWSVTLYYNTAYAGYGLNHMPLGYSVRCLRD